VSLRLGRPPIIILGMHRSGTSMVTRMLESLGLFVGRHKDKNHEATFFQGVNQWLLTQSGGSWDNPSPIHYLLESPGRRSQVTSYIAHSLLESPRLISFLGLAKYLHYRSLYELGIQWGWKDPRNTFTLPIWLDLFPGAKIIWIQRSAGDVAASLLRRERVKRWHSRVYESLGFLHWIRPKRRAFGSPRCDRLEGGYSLWQAYMSQATATLSSLSERPLVLRFEDILSDPLQGANALAQFCRLAAPVAQLRNVAAMVKSRSDSGFCCGQTAVVPAVVPQQSSARSSR